MNSALQKAAADGETSITATQRGYEYTLDIVALTQSNTSTGKVRKIRSAAQVSWQVELDSGWAHILGGKTIPGRKTKI